MFYYFPPNRAPPLCGAIPPAPDYICPAGSWVAAHLGDSHSNAPESVFNTRFEPVTHEIRTPVMTRSQSKRKRRKFSNAQSSRSSKTSQKTSEKSRANEKSRADLDEDKVRSVRRNLVAQFMYRSRSRSSDLEEDSNRRYRQPALVPQTKLSSDQRIDIEKIDFSPRKREDACKLDSKSKPDRLKEAGASKPVRNRKKTEQISDANANDSNQSDSEEHWILAEVIACNAHTSQYTIFDVDADDSDGYSSKHLSINSV